MIFGEKFDVMNQPDILPGRVNPRVGRAGRVEIFSTRAHLWFSENNETNIFSTVAVFVAVERSCFEVVDLDVFSLLREKCSTLLNFSWNFKLNQNVIKTWIQEKICFWSRISFFLRYMFILPFCCYCAPKSPEKTNLSFLWWKYLCALLIFPGKFEG